MYLIYEGPHLEVEVPHDLVTGGLIVAARGGPAVEFPDELAASLLGHGQETGAPVDAHGNPRTAVHQPTWRKATKQEIQAAEKGAVKASEAEEGGEVA